MAASISPDGLTIAAVLLTVAMWTRVEGGEDVPLPVLVLSTGLLALAKPPYFLVLVPFFASAFSSDYRRDGEGASFSVASVHLIK